MPAGNGRKVDGRGARGQPPAKDVNFQHLPSESLNAGNSMEELEGNLIEFHEHRKANYWMLPCCWNNFELLLTPDLTISDLLQATHFCTCSYLEYFLIQLVKSTYICSWILGGVPSSSFSFSSSSSSSSSSWGLWIAYWLPFHSCLQFYFLLVAFSFFSSSPPNLFWQLKNSPIMCTYLKLGSLFFYIKSFNIILSLFICCLIAYHYIHRLNDYLHY